MPRTLPKGSTTDAVTNPSERGVSFSCSLAPLSSSRARAASIVVVDDEGVQVRLAAPTPTMISRQIAGWGEHLDVVEPPELRAQLAQIGAELIERYRASAGDQPRASSTTS
ncbi:WYL domain-containing protein [Compostimonas suwonensis]|uniref:WYL domain-containing protein n=1 Tax=Compostimonas suwonensis TaxID=1048394 RepID=UPI001B8033A3|nr:WYL domain-containing protein [Compostimonas suwonensis]